MTKSNAKRTRPFFYFVNKSVIMSQIFQLVELGVFPVFFFFKITNVAVSLDYSLTLLYSICILVPTFEILKTQHRVRISFRTPDRLLYGS